MNKKSIIVLCALCVVAGPLFAVSEHWLGVAGAYSVGIIPDQDSDATVVQMSGFDIQSYSFFDKRSQLGLYIDVAFLFPIQAQKGNTTFDLSDSPMEFNLLVGPAFRHGLSEDATFNAALGFHISSQSSNNATSILGISVTGESSVLIIGAGLDAGIHLALSDQFFIRGGVRLGFDFGQKVSASGGIGGISGNTSDWTEDYFRFSATPYIGGGVYLNTGKRSGLGML
ncbi:MAG: hypothetical protein ACOX6K_07110 [Sphaerochaetaceae bacterium]|jgi:hypothetical protein